jgi:tetratricopeptide (TPR) repeat protein
VKALIPPSTKRALGGNGKKILLALILVLVIASCPAALTSPAKSDLKEVEVLIEQKQYKAALSRLDLIIQHNPSIAPAYADRARAYNNLGQYEKAIEDYSKAIRLDPKYALAYYNRGAAYCELGQNEKAIEDLSKVISFDPNNAQAYVLRAVAYEKSGKTDLALRDKDKAKELGYKPEQK